jgi:hypothetical protein
MAEHHYIVKYNDETKEWSQDTDSEEVRFPEGTIWDERHNEWFYSYQGDGIFYRDADIYDEQLSRFIDDLNRKK